MRFRPPEIPYTVDLRWVLGRAFGPATNDPESPSSSKTAPSAIDGATLGEPTLGSEALRLADQLGLSSRIAARHSRPVLTAELGAGAGHLLVARARAAAVGMMFERTAKQIQTVAQGLELRPIFLKGFAIYLGGRVQSGERPFGDLDVLVAEDHAQGLFDALIESGFRSSEVLPNAQHLPPLLAPDLPAAPDRGSGGSVDLHFRIRGVELRKGHWATADDLVDGDQIEELPGGWCIPRREVLLAHSLTHGLEQHGDRPDSYPLLRMISDLTSLTPAGASPTAAVDQILPLCPAVDSEEALGAAELAETLAAGDLPAEGSVPELLLRHFLAGVLVEGYGSERLGAHLRGRLQDARRSGDLAGHLGRKLWLNERELALRYGPPRHRWSHWGWRLRRPFDILWSLLRGRS